MDFRKTATDVLFGGGINVAIRLRGLVFIPLITGYLGIGVFGAYTQILAVVSLLSLVFGLGLHKGLVRYGHRRDNPADLYFSLLGASLLPTALVTVVLAATAGPLSSITLQTDAYAGAYRVGAALVLTRAVVRHARNYFRIDSRIKLYATIEGLRAYAMLGAVTISLAVFDTGLEGLLLAMVYVDTCIILVLHVKIVREVGVVLPSFEGLRRSLVYSIPSTASTFAAEITTRADRVLIGIFLGDVAVGVYAATHQIATSVSMYIMPIYQTFFPEFSKLIDEGKFEQCGAYLRPGARYFLIVAIPSVGGLFLVGVDVIALLTQSQATPSPVLVALLAASTVVTGVEIIYASVLDAAEEPDRRALYRGIGAATNVGLNVAVIPVFGIVGAAVATLIAFLIVAGLTVIRALSIVPTRLPWTTLVRCTSSTLVMVAFAVTFLPASPRTPLSSVIPISLTVVISAALYFALLFVSRELTLAEIQRAMPI